MNRRTMLLGAGSALVLGGGLWALTRKGDTTGLLPGPASAQDVTADPSLVPDMTLGNPDAKVTVIEYGSFTCPHCAEFHADVMPKLQENYIDTGKIKFVYRELVRNKQDIWASMLARCNGLRYFGVSDLIFTKQSEWAASGDPATIAQNLAQLGKVAGYDDATIQTCMSDAKMAQSIYQVSQDNAARDGVNSTPTFFINGQKYSNMSYEDFAKLLDEKLAG